MSTHILPEVSMTCDRVVIINKGRIVAVDTPANLTAQLKGAERVHLEVKADPDALRTAIEQIEGILAVDVEPIEGSEHLSVNVESEQGHDLRGRLAACVVGEGFDLFELRSVSLSLEDIFLQLTTEEQTAQPERPARQETVAAVAAKATAESIDGEDE